MLRTKEKNLLGRQSGAQGVQGNVCLDNPGVVIDRMTKMRGFNAGLKARTTQTVLYQGTTLVVPAPRRPSKCERASARDTCGRHSYQHWPRDGHRRLHVAGAGAGREAGRAHRPVFLWLGLYEMATGQRAFSGDAAAILKDAILNHTHPRRRLNPELPPKFEEIISKALEKDREARCQSASEMAGDLRSLKAGAYPSRRRARRTLAVSSLFALLMAIGVIFWLMRKKPSVAVLPEPEFRRVSFGRGVIPSARFTHDGQDAHLWRRVGGRSGSTFHDKSGWFRVKTAWRERRHSRDFFLRQRLLC